LALEVVFDSVCGGTAGLDRAGGVDFKTLLPFPCHKLCQFGLEGGVCGIAVDNQDPGLERGDYQSPEVVEIQDVGFIDFVKLGAVVLISEAGARVSLEPESDLNALVVSDASAYGIVLHRIDIHGQDSEIPDPGGFAKAYDILRPRALSFIYLR